MRTYQSKTVDCQPLQIENKIMNNSFATWPPKGLKLLSHSQTKNNWTLTNFDRWHLLHFEIFKNDCASKFFWKEVGHLNSFQMWGRRSCFGVPVTFFGLMSNLNEFRIGKEAFFVIDEMIRYKLEAVVVFFEWGYASLKQSLHIA